MWPTSGPDGSPAGDPGVDAGVEVAVWRCEAHRQDEAVESDRRGEPQEGDVVVISARVVVGMIDDPRDRTRHRIGVGPLLSLATEGHDQIACAAAEDQKKNKTVQRREKTLQTSRH